MENIFEGILNAVELPIVFVDTTHTITFMNKASIEKYKDKGGVSLVGKSIFACHNKSQKCLYLKDLKTPKWS